MYINAFDIVPYRSIGSINFTDSRNVVREKIGEHFMEGKYEFENLVELYDFFPDQDIKVLYDINECLGAIEFFTGGVYFNGLDIINTSYLDIKSALLTSDPNLEINQEGCTSYECGIGIGYDEDDDIITSVIVFKQDYYS